VKTSFPRIRTAWANDPATLISNGPYKLTKFEIKNEIVMEKNDKYFDAASLPGTKLIFKLTDDDAAALSAFKTGELDIAESFPAEETDAMKATGQYNVEPIIGTYFFSVEVQPREGNPEILQDPKFRKALRSVHRPRLCHRSGPEQCPASLCVRSERHGRRRRRRFP